MYQWFLISCSRATRRHAVISRVLLFRREEFVPVERQKQRSEVYTTQLTFMSHSVFGLQCCNSALGLWRWRRKRPFGFHCDVEVAGQKALLCFSLNVGANPRNVNCSVATEESNMLLSGGATGPLWEKKEKKIPHSTSFHLHTYVGPSVEEARHGSFPFSLH